MPARRRNLRVCGLIALVLVVGARAAEGSVAARSGDGPTASVSDGGPPGPTPPRSPSSAPATEPKPSGRADIVPSRNDLEVLGPHDLLEIEVFDVEQFSRTVRVADDGTITLPFLGRVEVAGLTRAALERNIAVLLGEKYVQDPQVSVFVKEHNSNKVSVSGAVKNPSTLELLGRKTLLDVVSEAGGFTEDVGRTVYLLRRKGDGTSDRMRIDLEKLIHGGDPSLNVQIVPGDVIYAPIEERITVYVNGAVKNPGGYEFKHGDTITALRAITKAGGLTERASERKVQILRLNPDGSQSTIPVDLRKVRDGKLPDPPLQREDVVDVPEAFF